MFYVFFTKFIPAVLRTLVSFSTTQSILKRRKLFACLYEFFKHHCLVCLAHFSVLAMKYNCLFFFYIFIAPRDITGNPGSLCASRRY